jgi:molecular chaperone HscC
MFGRPPLDRISPDEAVAQGAAIQIALKSGDPALDDLVATDVAPFSLGVSVVDTHGRRRVDDVFSPILERGTVLPASRVERFVTAGDGQATIRVQVYQGEHSLCRDNTKLGEYELVGIPAGPAGEEAIDVRFTYDLNGVLEVEACIVATKRKVTHVITRHARGLSEAAIRDSVREMQSLKTHPREETVNRFLVRRAERVFEELSLRERGVLEMLLHGFEEALELGDKDALERHRDALTEFLERCDGDDPGDHETYDQPW